MIGGLLRRPRPRASGAASADGGAGRGLPQIAPRDGGAVCAGYGTIGELTDAAVHRFDTSALYAALDVRRAELGLSWKQVADQLWQRLDRTPESFLAGMVDGDNPRFVPPWAGPDRRLRWSLKGPRHAHRSVAQSACRRFRLSGAMVTQREGR
jgi:hypothetical protein